VLTDGAPTSSSTNYRQKPIADNKSPEGTKSEREVSCYLPIASQLSTLKWFWFVKIPQRTSLVSVCTIRSLIDPNNNNNNDKLD
jgi:hypothetical protein